VGSGTGDLDGLGIGSVQQSKKILSRDGQQYPVNPLASQAGAFEQYRFSSSNLKQQSKKIPFLFGQQSPSRFAHPAFAEHEGSIVVVIVVVALAVAVAVAVADVVIVVVPFSNARPL
jgi:hypothetical protein